MCRSLGLPKHGGAVGSLIALFLFILIFSGISQAVQQDTGSPGASPPETGSADPLQPYLAQLQQQPGGGARISVPFLVIVDTNPAEFIDADILQDAQQPRMNRGQLRRLLPEFIPPGDQMIGLEELRAQGLTVEYDSALLQVQITRPVEPVQRDISLSGSGRDLFGTLVLPAAVSGYLNSELGISVDTLNTEQPETLVSADLQAVLNIVGWAAESQIYLSTGEPVSLTALVLTRDLIHTNLRLRAGLIDGLESPFGSGPELIGFQFGRIPEVSPRHPEFSLSLAQTQDFTAQMHLNDRALRELDLEPGSYSVDGFPLMPGINRLRVTLSPDPQNGYRRNYTIPYDTRLLPQGYHNFGGQLGFPRKEFSPPITTGSYQYGVSNRVTGGIFLQAGEGGQLLGTQWILGTDIGMFDLGLAGSAMLGKSERQPGVSLLGGYRFTLPGREGVPRFSLTARYSSESFAVYGRTPTGGLTLSAAIAQNLFSSLWISLTGNYEHRESLDRFRASLVMSHPITEGMDLRLTGALTFVDGGVEPRGVITLSSSGGNQPLTMGVSQNLEDGSVGFNASHTSRFDDSTYGIAGSASGLPIGSSNSASGSLGGSFTGQRFTAGAQYQIQSAGSRFAARFGTALAFAGPTLAISRPIRESFVIIRNTKSLQDYRILINPQEELYRAGTDFLGPAILADVSRYSPSRVIIDAPEAPADVPLGTTQFVVKPGFRSGTLIDVGGISTTRLVGRLVTPERKPAALRGGFAQLLDSDASPELFYTDERGYFEIPALEPGRYEIGLYGGIPDRWIIEIPQDAPRRFEIDPLTIQSQSNSTNGGMTK